MSSLMQTKILSDIIYKQKKMIEQLSHVSESIYIFNNTKLIIYLQAELHTVNKSEVDLEIFKSEKDINELNISILIK